MLGFIICLVAIVISIVGLIVQGRRHDSDIDKLQQEKMKQNRAIVIIQEIIEVNERIQEKTAD